MQELKKGDTIQEYEYGITITSVITSDVVVKENGQREFTSVTESGREIEYLVGGAYGADVWKVEV
jgi:hypothetical protein